jgi:hypothetical protein
VQLFDEDSWENMNPKPPELSALEQS